jgi:hypothetical protein
MTDLAGWRWLRVVAWSLAGLTALVLAAALVLLGLDLPVLDAGRVAVYVVSALAIAVSAGIGCLIATRLPANAIGWLLSVIGLSLTISMFAELYALRGLAVAAGSLPAAGLAGWLSEPAVVLTFGLLLSVVLLFPDGRLPSRRWRPVLWVICPGLSGQRICANSRCGLPFQVLIADLLRGPVLKSGVPTF